MKKADLVNDGSWVWKQCIIYALHNCVSTAMDSKTNSVKAEFMFLDRTKPGPPFTNMV